MAHDWLRLILDEGDLPSAWKLTDPDFRLVLTQAWTWANRDHPYLASYDAETIARELAQEETEHALWKNFEHTQLSEMQEAWSEFRLDTWGAASRPRPTVPNYELVLFADTGGEMVVYTEPTQVFAIGVLLHLTPSGWLVANAGDPGPSGVHPFRIGRQGQVAATS